MTRSQSLSSRLAEVLLSGRWIANTNFKEQILQTSWQQAVYKVENLNTIAALTFHIDYYIAGILSAFETGKLEIRDQYSYDWPAIQSEADWQKLVAAFILHAESFVAKVAGMKEEMLAQPFFDEKYGNYERNIEGVIEHSYYHLGQVSLLRKLIP